MTTAISIEDVRREVKVLRALTGHNNLVQFYDAYEDQKNVYIVMELCEGGELLDRILSRGGKFSEDDARAVMVQILNVVAFCHLQGVVHRDLKPEEKMEAMRDSRNTEASTVDASSLEVNGEMDDMSIYKQVMGGARSGQVPGYGKGPNPSQVFGTQRHNQEAERERMRQEIAEMEARVRIEIKEEVQAQIQTEVQAQVAAFLRNMGFQPPLVPPSVRVDEQNGERVQNEDIGEHGDE